MSYLSFAKAALERAVKTFAQAWAAVLTAAGTGLLDSSWEASLSVAGMAALLSFLASVASAPFGGTGPSLANEVTSPPAYDPADDHAHLAGDTGATVGDVVLVVVGICVVLLTLVSLGVIHID